MIKIEPQNERTHDTTNNSIPNRALSDSLCAF